MELGWFWMDGFDDNHLVHSHRCAQFVSSGADLIPSYCNIALLHNAEESSTVKARWKTISAKTK